MWNCISFSIVIHTLYYALVISSIPDGLFWVTCSGGNTSLSFVLLFLRRSIVIKQKSRDTVEKRLMTVLKFQVWEKKFNNDNNIKCYVSIWSKLDSENFRVATPQVSHASNVRISETKIYASNLKNWKCQWTFLPGSRFCSDDEPQFCQKHWV